MIDRTAVILVEALKSVTELWERKQCLTDGRRTISGGVELCYPAWVRRLHPIQHLIVRRKRNVELRHVTAISCRSARGARGINHEGVRFQRLNVGIKRIQDVDRIQV